MPAYYDKFDYPAYWEGRDYEHESEVVAIREFLNKIEKIERILDLGCGFGRLSPYYSYRAKKVYLIDPSSSLLKKAKSLLKSERKSIKFIQSKLENATKKVKPKSFDLVVFVRVMHHIEDPDRALSVLSKLIKPGGYLILEFPNKLHSKALFKNICKGNITFPFDIFPDDKRSEKNKKIHSIPFLNFHPDDIGELLKKYKFRVVEKRSVSNIRNEKAKKNLPKSFLLFIEKLLQKPFSHINFGPSIFILAQKKG